MLTALTAGLPHLVGIAQPLPIVSAHTPEKRGTQQAPLTAWGYSGPGITMAQQKRASRKARNVRRHKAHARRAA